jgi:hypothetical protein
MRDEEGRFITWKPLFWIKVENERVDINSPDITCAVRTLSKGIHSMVQLNSVKEYKKTKPNMPILHFLDLVKNNKQILLHKANWNWREKELFSFDDKQKVFNSIDSVRVQAPFTNEITIQVVQNNIDLKNINEISLVQEWAWDDKRKTLFVRLLGIAPIGRNYNEVGDYLFSRPVFYQRFDD